MDRGALRIGGAGALAAAAAGAARLAVGVSVHRSALQAFGPQPSALLLLALLGGVAALALACAAYGAWAALVPSTRLLRTVTLAGGLGAVAALGASAIETLRSQGPGLRPGAASGASLVVSYLALFATTFWIVGVCAIDWRRRRWPAWVRVAGTAAGVFALSAVVLPELGALALPLTLAFWLGLGVSLLRMATPGSE